MGIDSTKMSKDKVDPELIEALEEREKAIGSDTFLDDIPAARKVVRKLYETAKEQLAEIEGVSMKEYQIHGPPDSPEVTTKLVKELETEW